VTVAAYADLASMRGLTDPMIDAIMRGLNDGKTVLVTEEWIADDDEMHLEPAENCQRVFFGSLLDSSDGGEGSDGAWKFTNNARSGYSEWVPKSQSTVYQLHDDIDTVTTPQQGLGAFARGGGA
jgi:hypothetical protein